MAGALRNGGLYIKLGQGLGSFNQVLPRQFIDTLKSLQDKVCVVLVPSKAAFDQQGKTNAILALL